MAITEREEKLKLKNEACIGITIQEKSNRESKVNKRVEKGTKIYHAMNGTFIDKKQVSKTTTK